MDEQNEQDLVDDVVIVEDQQDEAQEGQEGAQGGPETFPRAYVEKLRQENAQARVKAQRADELAKALHIAQVAATGRLTDPTDLPYDESLLNDPAALTAALDTLLDRKPHLASRTPRGDIGQGAKGGSGSVDLAAILRHGA